jgi:putative DNA methylase
MPNHVHVLITPLNGNSLSPIVHSWKSFTAKEANKRLGRSGTFWQEEYFDRAIRDESHFRGAVEYIEYSPVRAGLIERPENWELSSAHLGEEKRAGRPRSQDALPLAEGGTGAKAYADAVGVYWACGISRSADFWSNIWFDQTGLPPLHPVRAEETRR